MYFVALLSTKKLLCNAFTVAIKYKYKLHLVLYMYLFLIFFSLSNTSHTSLTFACLPINSRNNLNNAQYYIKLHLNDFALK